MYMPGFALATAAAFLVIGLAPGSADAADLQLKKQDTGKVEKLEPVKKLESKPKLEKVSPKPKKTRNIKPAKPSPAKSLQKPKKASIKPKSPDTRIGKPDANKLKKLNVSPDGGQPPKTLKKASVRPPKNFDNALKKDLIKPSTKTLVKDLEPNKNLRASGAEMQALESSEGGGVVDTSVSGLQIDPGANLSKDLAAPSVKDLAVQPQIREGLNESVKQSLEGKLDGNSTLQDNLQGLAGDKGSTIGERAGFNSKLGKQNNVSKSLGESLTGFSGASPGGRLAGVLQDSGSGDAGAGRTLDVVVNGESYTIVRGGSVQTTDTFKDVRNHEWVKTWYANRNDGKRPHGSWIAKNEDALEDQMAKEGYAVEIVTDAEMTEIYDAYQERKNNPDQPEESDEGDAEAPEFVKLVDDGENEEGDEDSWWTFSVDILYWGDDEEEEGDSGSSGNGSSGQNNSDSEQTASAGGSGGTGENAGGSDDSGGAADEEGNQDEDGETASEDADCPEGDEDCGGSEADEETGDDMRTVEGDQENPSSCEEAGGCEGESPEEQSGGDGTVRTAGSQEDERGGPLKGDTDTSPANGTLRLADEEQVGGELVRGEDALRPVGDRTLRLPEGEDDDDGGTPQVAGGSGGGGIGNPGVVTEGAVSGGQANVQQDLNLQSGELKVDNESLQNVTEQAGQ